MIRVAVPAVLTLVLVASLIGLSGWNRSGDPRLALTLTERELSLPWNPSPAPDEDPGLQLRIEIERRSDPLDARTWLTDERLRAIGFALNVPPGAPEAEETYQRMPPRLAWVAFEYGGSTWREVERRRAMRRESEGWRPAMEATRLVPVDVAVDFDALQVRYPTGHLILRAVIAVSFRGAQEGGPLVYGNVRELVPGAVTVPRHLRPVLDGLSPPTYARSSSGEQPVIGPRYDVELAIGRLGIPYLRAIRRLGQ